VLEPNIFKAYDVRGIYPDQMDERVAYQLGRGFARASLKRHILALTDFEMASRRDPKNAHAALGRARVWAERKDYAQARAEGKTEPPA